MNESAAAKSTKRFPLRFKILLGLLVVVSVVVTIITYTMANLFHTDKTTYIHDLTSVMALRAADETTSLLHGYRERLQTYAIVLNEEGLADGRRVELVRQLMDGFPECVAIATFDGPEEILSTIYDAQVLESAGLTKDDITGEMESLGLPWESLSEGRPFLRSAVFSDKMPSVFLATRVSAVDSLAASQFVCAVLKVDGLRRAASQSEAVESFVADSRRVLISHRDLDRVRNQDSPDWLPDLSTGTLSKARSMTREFTVGQTEMIGGFAATGFDGVLVGAQVPRSAAYLASRELLGDLVLVSLGLLLFAALAALFWARRITGSIERLVTATRRVGRGEFDIRVEEESRDEIGGLAQSFNQMATELRTREAALKEANNQLVQSEKLAAFGQLGAGIAHEIKNPLAGILGCTQLSLRGAGSGTPLETNLKMIERETRRCKDIIENLLRFARQEKAELAPLQLAPVIDDAVAIVRHQLELAGVELVVQNEAELPEVLGNGNQIQQVVMNLMINAQQAMGDTPAPRVAIGCRAHGENEISILVADNGPGIPPEHRARIFEPFFTTKPSGVGTGLGLSVSYGIVRDHGGRIELDSDIGKGTIFRLIFPIAGPDAVERIAEASAEATPGPVRTAEEPGSDGTDNMDERHAA